MNQFKPISGPLAAATRLSALAATLAVAACGGGAYGGGGSMAQGPSVSLAVTPTTISLGQPATLTWSATAGASCAASGDWSGAQANDGTRVVTPTTVGTASYVLACTVSGGAYGGGGATTTKTATLTVNAAVAAAFSQTALVADANVGSRTTDARLVNPWGLAFGPTSPVWVVNNRTASGTVYDGNGVAQPHAAPLVVAFPSDAAGAAFDPTGIVHNASTTDFVISSGNRSATATFIFAGESGRIGAWSNAVDPANVVTTYTDAGGAVYKGLALARHGAASFLYATDFHNGRVDVFDASFAKQTTSATAFSFVDPTLPAGYAPFGIQAVDDGPGGATQLYVSYAQQALPDKHDHTSGAGLGLVDVFDTNGALVSHLVAAGGALNAPWGIALAPADFGAFGGKLLVGNVGDGRINAFDPASGQFLGAVADAGGTAFAVPGLWGIAFGNDAHNQPHNTLFYSAGTNAGANGALGRVDAGAVAPALGTPPAVALTSPTGTVSGLVPLTATATDPLGISSVQFFVNNVTLGTVTTAPYTIPWDTTTIPDGSVLLNVKATDPDGNVAVSPAVTVTVANHVAAATTLTQIQTDVFTPLCSGCHNGSNPPGGALPGSQNLTAGNSFASLVSVASHEQPGILRVSPGDPTNSYLIQKLEGAAGISGQRMPLGGPFLDQATIDKIKSWIAAGAANN